MVDWMWDLPDTKEPWNNVAVKLAVESLVQLGVDVNVGLFPSQVFYVAVLWFAVQGTLLDNRIVAHCERCQANVSVGMYRQHAMRVGEE